MGSAVASSSHQQYLTNIIDVKLLVHGYIRHTVALSIPIDIHSIVIDNLAESFPTDKWDRRWMAANFRVDEHSETICYDRDRNVETQSYRSDFHYQTAYGTFIIRNGMRYRVTLRISDDTDYAGIIYFGIVPKGGAFMTSEYYIHTQNWIQAVPADHQKDGVYLWWCQHQTQYGQSDIVIDVDLSESKEKGSIRYNVNGKDLGIICNQVSKAYCYVLCITCRGLMDGVQIQLL